VNVIGTIAAERTFDLPLDPAIIEEIGKFWWPLDRLGEGVEELSRRAGLRRDAIAEPLSIPPSFLAGRSFEVSDWFDWAADRLGIEAVSIDTAASELPTLFRAGGPAILLTDVVGQTGFVMIVRSKRGVPQLLAPDLSVGSCRVETLRTALCWFREAPMVIEIDRVLGAAGVSDARKEAVKAAMLAERLSAVRISPMWLLRLSASSSFWQQMVQAGVVGKLSGLLAVFAVMYVLEIAGWSLIGTAALGGRLDMGWLAAWVLLVMSMIPWRIAGAWFAAIFALDTGRILKSRLLAGALRMDTETIKQQGVGHLLGRVMESQALESLALTGGVAVLVAIMELAFAGWILMQGAGGGTHLVLLLGWSLFSFWLCWRYYVRLRTWSFERLDMTHDLIEAMVGHRTRLAQENATQRESVEDIGLQNYLAASKALDTSGVFVISGASSGWILVGLAGLLPVFVSDAAISPTAIAISLGGMLLAQRAFGGIGGGLAGLARAAIAWGQVSEMFHAAHERTASHRFITDWQIRHGPAPTARLIDAQGLSFRYASTGETVLEGIDLKIDHGERLLLEGASGGGKSTLATLLAGLNRSASGLLLLNGLDRHTLGDDWHRIATSAPQFHENHILSGTVAFNLLMGRQWPAPPELIEEAAQLCHDLGLGDLLQRMPAGINQRIGETGWQLSHGERSRIFLGRALLQGAHLTVLDESFAALDPETLERCLQCTLERTRTLVVIAHP
jgi:ATP-binding cassette, subfamily B, bacterial